jgi:proton-translocating NADH-quinone oxidoreductase chain M
MTALNLINILIGIAIIWIVANRQYLEHNGKVRVNQQIVFDESIRWVVLGIQGLLVIISCVMIINIESPELIQKISPYYNMATLYSNNANINIGYNIDGISAIFILLTITLIISCILISWRVIKKKHESMFQIMLLVTEILIINFFAATDIIQLYILYEAVLIPIVIMIGLWGSRTERKIAAFQILIYTLVGSIFMLMSIGLIYSNLGTTDYIMVRELIEVLPENIKTLIFVGFFVGFAVKIPIAPLHLWLLRAHVEAPTAGSVLLAGILLKLGGYGYIRYNVGLFPELCEYYFPIIGGICLISILYTGIATLTQLDVKRIVAYSSISHMNVVVLGLFSGVLQGIEGGVILMIGHGVVSGGLFLCIGVIYDRCKTRILYAYNNLVHVMPILAIMFFLLVLGNIAFPITSNFVGELLIFIGLIKKNIIIAFFSALSMIVTAIYSFWLYNRIFFVNEIIAREANETVTVPGISNLNIERRDKKGIYFTDWTVRGGYQRIPKTVKKENIKYGDVDLFEFSSIALMVIWMLILGMKPNMVESLIAVNCLELISK